MTSKERAALRGEANTLEPLFQIGKGGVTDAVVRQTLDAFNTRELMKVKVLLETSPETPRDTAAALAQATDSQVVQVIGGSIILYKINPELRKREAEKQKRRKEQQKAKKARAQAGAKAAKYAKPIAARAPGFAGNSARRSKPVAKRQSSIKSK